MPIGRQTTDETEARHLSLYQHQQQSAARCKDHVMEFGAVLTPALCVHGCAATCAGNRIPHTAIPFSDHGTQVAARGGRLSCNTCRGLITRGLITHTAYCGYQKRPGRGVHHHPLLWVACVHTVGPLCSGGGEGARTRTDFRVLDSNTIPAAVRPSTRAAHEHTSSTADEQHAK